MSALRRRAAPRPATRLRRILHATDFSPASRRALGMATALARLEGGTLLLLHVLTPPSPFLAGSGPRPVSYLDLLAAARREGRRRLAALAARLRGAGVRVQARLVEGGAAERILSIARGWRADVIVIGTHGRTGVRHFLMGSVAEHVVRRASRPVLTVRGG
jgi:nucleotide-binding universal stress UspA family protein